MRSRSRITISSGVYGKAFLATAWEARHDLLDYERRGFAQFFYLTIFGHLEGVIAEVVKTRLKFVEVAIKWDNLPPIEYTNNGSTARYSVEPVTSSIRRIVESIEAESNSAPFFKLAELYSRIFGRTLPAVLGQDLHEELKALATLRNVFAHGRDLKMEFDADPVMGYQGTLDGNVLKHPAQRLHQAGVIGDLMITGANHDDFLSMFFGDGAMLHFYNAVRTAEDLIRSASDFVPEQSWQSGRPLPDLHA